MALMIGLDRLPVLIFSHNSTMIDGSDRSGEGGTTIIVILNIGGALKPGAVQGRQKSGGGYGVGNVASRYQICWKCLSRSDVAAARLTV